MTELVFRDAPYRRDCTATVVSAADGRVVLDRTVFYPNGGGQPGDRGVLTWQTGSVPVLDTVKGDDAPFNGVGGDGSDTVVHIVGDDAPLPRPGDVVRAEIDWDRRHRLMRMHTTLHLLCSLVEGDVTGGQVGLEKSRLDFNIPAGTVDKAGLTHALNQRIQDGHPVVPDWIDEDTLAARPELVRTMSVKPPTGSGRVRIIRIGPAETPVDLQPCGGTHVADTAEIGAVAVTKIENKGKQNRRINVALIDGETR